MNNEQAVVESRIPLHREIIEVAYRALRMTRDDAGAEILARQAFRADMLRPVDMLTGKKRPYPMTDAEFGRWSAYMDGRWSRWLASPGAIRPPRFDHDGRRQAGF